MSDLYWERIQAGHYETTFFVNGYKYKITGEGIDWHCYYKYRTKKSLYASDWRHIPHGSFSDRLKKAKIFCQIHNDNPRRKFKIIGREKIGFINPRIVMSFGEVIKDRKTGEEKIRDHGRFHFELPEFYESYSGEVSYLGEDYMDIMERMNKAGYPQVEDIENQYASNS